MLNLPWRQAVSQGLLERRQGCFQQFSHAVTKEESVQIYMTPTSLEFCVESFIEDLNLSSPQENEFYVILEEMQYLKLTLLQEGFLERE